MPADILPYPQKPNENTLLGYRFGFDPQFFGWSNPFSCPKSGVVECPNIVLHFLCRHLESNPNIKQFGSSKRKFGFFDPKTGKIKTDYFSLEIVTKDQQNYLVYATSQAFLYDPAEESRIEAAEAEASRLKLKFLLVTEPEVFGPNPEFMRSIVNYIFNKGYLRKDYPNGL